MRRLPYDLAVLRVDRKETAAGAWIQTRRASTKATGLRTWSACRHRLGLHVRQRGVHTRAVERGAPLHAAQGAAFTNGRLPENLAAAIGIERMHDACLMT